ncbi:lipase family protein [Streptomyces sp. NPDC056909]|uniref:lipase family protein n=1 Tax=unclassified Streptomyces TaxID=2593676 RepID=UPI003428BB64
MPLAPLDHHATGYQLSHAYWLAKASELAYRDQDIARAALAEWGFDRFRHFESRHQMPFPLEDTQAYTAASDRMIITAFRGTTPHEIRDWLTDGNTPPVPGPGNKGFVHYGFHQALASVYPDVRDAIEEFRTGGQTVWFTGHSLGGALAMLAGTRLYFEEPRILADGIYTYGQPRTCDRLLAAAYNTALKDRTYRFVNNNDIVPQVPPAPLFTHVDTVKYFDSHGTIHDRLPFVDVLRDRVTGRTADLFAPASDGIRDHFMPAYLANLEKNLV